MAFQTCKKKPVEQSPFLIFSSYNITVLQLIIDSLAMYFLIFMLVHVEKLRSFGLIV